MPPGDIAAISVSSACVVLIIAAVVVVLRRRRGTSGKKTGRVPPAFRISFDSDICASAVLPDAGAPSATGAPRQSSGATPLVFTAFVCRLSEWQAAMRVSSSVGDGAPTFGSLLRRLSDGVAAMRTSSTEGAPVSSATPRLRRLSQGVAAVLAPSGSADVGGLTVCVPSPKASPRDEEDISPTYGGTPSSRFEAAMEAVAPAVGEADHITGGMTAAAEATGNPSLAIVIGMRAAGAEPGVRLHSSTPGGTRGGTMSPPRYVASSRVSSPGRAALSSLPHAAGSRRLSSPAEMLTGSRLEATSPGRQRFSSPPSVRNPSWLPAAPGGGGFAAPGSLSATAGDDATDQQPNSPTRARPTWRP